MPESRQDIRSVGLVIRFFRWFCRTDYVEDIEGDLLERFESFRKQGSLTIARLKLFLEVLKLLQPDIVKPIFESQRLNNYGMFRNYLKTTIRSARKEKAFTLLNVSCLTIGLCACFYIGVYTIQEFSFDKFHEKADRIYRINQTFIWGDVDQLFGSTGPAVMGAIQEEIPEFESMTRVQTFENALVSVISSPVPQVFEEQKLRAVDETFFDVFTFPLVAGNPSEALKNPQSLVLTESTALKYFGHTDVLGEQIRIEEDDSNKIYQVTGIAKDVPDNSHVTFDLLISTLSIDRLRKNGDTWWWTTFVTFGVLRVDADTDLVAAKVASVPGKYLEPFLLKYRGMTYKEFLETGESWDLYMQPLLDIHLYSTHVFSRLNEIGDIKTVYILNVIALLILTLSITNFVNLTTARASRRMKEVGIRKVLGTRRSGLIAQFTLESVFMCGLSFFSSAILLYFLLPVLNDISGKEISIEAFIQPSIVLAYILVVIFIGIVSGIYPAFYLTRIKPVKAFKADHSKESGNGRVRNVLIVFQFAVSIGLIACSIIIHEQVQHWLNMELGFNKDNVLIIRRVDRLDQSRDSFVSSVQNLASVEHLSLSNDTPPYVMGSRNDFYLDVFENEKAELSYWLADENFINVYDLKLLAGDNFLPGGANKSKVLVSESTLVAFGLQNPEDILGRSLKVGEDEQTVIGVFEDIRTEIKWKQLPIAIYYNDAVFSPVGEGKELSIRFSDQVNGSALATMVEDIEAEWLKFSGGMPIQYYFLDQRFKSLFNPSIMFGKLMNFFAILSCFIASLGLIGLVAYVIERRNKEIGIRKILGASISSILYLLTSDFGKLLAIGFLLATSVSWYFMHQWIDGFTDQITLSPGLFMVAGLVMLVLVLVTLSIQVVRAALSNPVKYLRDE